MKKLTITGHLIKGPPAAYCSNEIHKGYLSEYLVRKHKCLIKRCKHFIGITMSSTYEPERRTKKRRRAKYNRNSI